jgi:hypothetical protein
MYLPWNSSKYSQLSFHVVIRYWLICWSKFTGWQKLKVLEQCQFPCMRLIKGTIDDCKNLEHMVAWPSMVTYIFHIYRKYRREIVESR